MNFDFDFKEYYHNSVLSLFLFKLMNWKRLFWECISDLNCKLGNNDILPCDICETVGAITHFSWVATFGWIGKHTLYIFIFYSITFQYYFLNYHSFVKA